MALGMIIMPNLHLIDSSVSARNAGASDATDDTIPSWHSIYQQKFMPLLKQAADEAVGGRKEAATIYHTVAGAFYLPIAGSAKAAALMYDWLESKQSAWGGPADRSQLIHCYNMHAHSRHFELARNSTQRLDVFFCWSSASAVAEHAGDMKQAERLLAKQLGAWDDYVEAAPAPNIELGLFLILVSASCLGCP